MAPKSTAERLDWRSPVLWVELFVAANLAGLAPDIYLAHSTNRFRHAAEWVPMGLSIVAPLLLVVAVARWRASPSTWRWLGGLVGVCSIATGIVGLVLHLESGFFQERTLASLVYAAPFAAPLAYTGLGLLLLLDRMVVDGEPWSRWVLLLATGGLLGNFVFSVTDHAQNGFFRPIEWLPVVSSALAVGFLLAPFFSVATAAHLRASAAVLVANALIGVAGFVLHIAADVRGPAASLFANVVHGAPAFAPLLLPDLAALGLIAIVATARR